MTVRTVHVQVGAKAGIHVGMRIVRIRQAQSPVGNGLLEQRYVRQRPRTGCPHLRGKHAAIKLRRNEPENRAVVVRVVAEQALGPRCKPPRVPATARGCCGVDNGQRLIRAGRVDQACIGLVVVQAIGIGAASSS